MNWYIAKLVFQVQSDDGLKAPHFDEQWRLIKADESTWALEKARVLGWLEGGFFGGENQAKTRTRFIEVAEIQQIYSMEDGAQLFSSIESPTDTNAYVEFIRRKAKQPLNLVRNQ